MGKDGDEGDGMVTALYKLNLHCPQCARQLRKPLIRTEGVRTVDVDYEKGEIKVHGKVDAKKIHRKIEKISKKKVEMVIIDTKSKGKEEEKNEKKEEKKAVLSKTMVKVHMHCPRCEHDLKQMILKRKDVYSIKSDFKAQTLEVEGIIEPPKLVEYIRKKVHKHAEIVIKKVEKKEEKKEEVKKVDIKVVETKKIAEYGEEKKVEAKIKETDAPYFVHYVYAPQLFSDENPNACSVM